MHRGVRIHVSYVPARVCDVVRPRLIVSLVRYILAWLARGAMLPPLRDSEFIGGRNIVSKCSETSYSIIIKPRLERIAKP